MEVLWQIVSAYNFQVLQRLPQLQLFIRFREQLVQTAMEQILLRLDKLMLQMRQRSMRRSVIGAAAQAQAAPAHAAARAAAHLIAVAMPRMIRRVAIH